VTTLLVEGMSCEACVRSVSRGLGRLPGVGRVEVDLASGQVRVEHEPGRPTIDELRAAVDDLGYDVRAAP
jgi:copper chaperone CopZ